MFSDLIPRIRNWAKSVPSKSEPKLMKVCDHDWETVKVSGTLERMIESIDGVSDVDADFRMLITEEINKEKERARRRELARKMWRNCHE
jgi:hypothetical protein